MTRINYGIDVRCLTDEHLLAEHREIKRMTSFYNKRLKQKKFNDIPKNFVLGKGHMTFFLDKGLFTFQRYKQIYKECKKRNLDVVYYGSNWEIYKIKHCKNCIPRLIEKAMVANRIIERITESKKKQFHYCKMPFSKRQSIKKIYEICSHRN